MENSNNEMDQLLQVIDTSKVPGYQEFMHDLIVEDISNHDLNFETLNSFLFEWNKQVYDAVCEKAISYYDTYATEKIKSRELNMSRQLCELFYRLERNRLKT